VINDEGDTIWIRKAERLFENVDEINFAYKEDSGAKKAISRYTAFKKSFRWFNTEYRFSESIDRKLYVDYPVGDFLNENELLYFYSPKNLKHKKESGPDSLKYRALSDSVNQKVEAWNTKCLISLWINEFSKLIQKEDGGQRAAESLKSHEDELLNMILIDEEKFDSLWSNGMILKEFIGATDYEKFSGKVDTADDRAIEQFWLDFKEYSVKIAMPGNVTGTNGFIDSSEVLLWPVKSDYFLTETYEMWAESKIPNIWAWIVSGLFLVFVLTGVIIRVIKKG